MRRAPTPSQPRGGKFRGKEQEHSDPVCSICRSGEFYEDDQGGMICVACGTQSQDFLAEGFDEDDLAVYGGGTGNMVTQRNEARGPKSLDQSKKDSKVDLIPDTLEALKLYQYVLQMLAEACWAHSKLEESEDGLNAFRNTVKALWMDYLNAWQSSTLSTASISEPVSSSSRRTTAVKRCSIGMAFSRSSTCRCRCKHIGTEKGHPLRPSKPLLLGFVYLGLRIMRSSVLVSDIVRWIECGSVPYASLWEAIPLKQRESVGVEMNWFYDHPVGRKRPLINTESIFFHACSLSQTLRPQIGAALPPLNVPLVAHKLISALGLPSVVWEMYVSVAQLFSAHAPIIGAGTMDQHYEEYIMAVLIVAVKLCPRWTTWEIVRDEPADAEMSNTATFANGSSSVGGYELSRSQLPAVLAQIRRTHRVHTALADTARLHYRLNNSVYAALGGDPDALKKHVSDGAPLTPHHQQHHGGSRLSLGGRSAAKPALRSVFKDAPRFADHTSYAYSAHSQPVALHGESLLAEELSLKDRRNLAYLYGVEPTFSDKMTASEKQGTQGGESAKTAAYVAYTRYSRDETGLYHVPYLTLLERCAKYLYTNPQLLHELVCKLETQIVNLAFTGQHAAEGAVTAKIAQTSDEIPSAVLLGLNDVKTRGKKRSAQLRDVGRYQAESDKVLPKLRRRGLRTLAIKAQLRHRGAPYVGASEPSGGEDGDSSSDDQEEGPDAEPIVLVSATNLKPVVTAAEKTWSLPPFRFSKAASFWDVECAFGTDIEVQGRPTAKLIHKKTLKSSKSTGKATAETGAQGTQASAMNTGDETGDPERSAGSEQDGEVGAATGSASDSPLLQSEYDSSGASEWERAMYGPSGLVSKPTPAAASRPSASLAGSAHKIAPQTQVRQTAHKLAGTPTLLYNDGASEEGEKEDDDFEAPRKVVSAPPRPCPVTALLPASSPPALSLRSLIGLSGPPIVSAAPAAFAAPASAARANPVTSPMSVLAQTAPSQTPSLRALIGLSATPARSAAPTLPPHTLPGAKPVQTAAARTPASPLPQASPPKALSLRDLIGLPPAPVVRTSPPTASAAAQPIAATPVPTASAAISPSMPVSEPESPASLSANSEGGGEDSTEDEGDWDLGKRKVSELAGTAAGGEQQEPRPVVAMKRPRAAAYSIKPE